MAITVTKEFRKAFKKCMDEYKCTEDEIAYEKARVRANYKEAERCYLSIAASIKEPS